MKLLIAAISMFLLQTGCSTNDRTQWLSDGEACDEVQKIASHFKNTFSSPALANAKVLLQMSDYKHIATPDPERPFRAEIQVVITQDQSQYGQGCYTISEDIVYLERTRQRWNITRVTSRVLSIHAPGKTIDVPPELRRENEFEDGDSGRHVLYRTFLTEYYVNK